MFDKNINTLEEIQQDLSELYKIYDVTPSKAIMNLNFNSYIRHKNFDGRVIYNGNASFFLEPLEATSTQFMIDIAVLASRRISNSRLTDDYLNEKYHRYANVHKSIILYHYLYGSQNDTEFWKQAKIKAERGYDPTARYDREHSHWQDWNWEIHDDEFKKTLVIFC